MCGGEGGESGAEGGGVNGEEGWVGVGQGQLLATQK